MNTIIHRYIFKELIPPFVINLAFFTFIFLMAQILEITNLIVNYQIGISKVILLLIYAMPFFLQFIIPMAGMISVLLTFLRMSADQEIVALKAGGISIGRLISPVLLFGLLGLILTAFMAIIGLPQGRTASRVLLYEVASAHLDAGLKQRQFYDSFKDVILYIHQIDPHTKTLTDIFIEDRRSTETTSTVLAPRGIMTIYEDQMLVHLRLFNGTIHQVDVTLGTAHALSFDTYDIWLNIKPNLPVAKGGVKDEEEMSLGELRQYIQDTKIKDDQYYLALMEWHKKFSLPTACLVLTLLGMPLGIQVRRAKKAYGIGLGLVFFLFYYMLLSAGWVFGEAGVYPPVIGMWMPNLIFGVIGIFLLHRGMHEKSLPRPVWGFLLKYKQKRGKSGSGGLQNREKEEQ